MNDDRVDTSRADGVGGALEIAIGAGRGDDYVVAVGCKEASELITDATGGPGHEGERTITV